MSQASPSPQPYAAIGSCFFDHEDFDANVYLTCPKCDEERGEPPTLAPTATPSTALAELTSPVPFKNRYLSVSRLKRFEQCPKSFELHYVQKKPSEQTAPLLFGTLLHTALEELFRWVVREEFSGRIPEERLLEFYREAWTSSGLSGGTLYNEGLTILRTYLREHPDVDHFQILAVEVEFNIQLEEFLINGRIDRVDKLDDETLAIIDYKSNRLLFSREEVDNDIQMSVYALAARKLWPWAKRVVYVFHMLRHGVELGTDRSDEQIDDAATYVLATGRQTERNDGYPARLNPNCGYCDHRRDCSAYTEALARGAEMLPQTPAELDAISKQRERVHVVIKILEGRKRELDTIIRAQLSDRESITLADITYRLVPWSTATLYPMRETLELVARTFSNVPGPDIAEAVLGVDNKRLEIFLETHKTTIPRPKMLMLRAQLDAMVKKVPGAPRLLGTPIKGKKKPIERPSAALPSAEILALPEASTLPHEDDSDNSEKKKAPRKPRTRKVKEPAT